MDNVRIIEIKESFFADNDREVQRVRDGLRQEKTFLMNLMSSPGAVLHTSPGTLFLFTS